MSTTATVTIEWGRDFPDGGRRVIVRSPNGDHIAEGSEGWARSADLPLPLLPVPGPPEGCALVIDRYSIVWTRLTNGAWGNADGGMFGWVKLLGVRGPVTPLTPGAPIGVPV